MKKQYTAPVIEEIKISRSDILSGSDVLIDGSELWSDK